MFSSPQNARIVWLGGLAIGHNTHQPGWRWSEYIRPIVKTEWCETHHVGIALSGRFRFHLSSGLEFEVGPHDVFGIPPGHDGWVVGDDPYESVEWTGVRSWIPEHDLMAARNRTRDSNAPRTRPKKTPSPGISGDQIWVVAPENWGYSPDDPHGLLPYVRPRRSLEPRRMRYVAVHGRPQHRRGRVRR